MKTFSHFHTTDYKHFNVSQANAFKGSVVTYRGANPHRDRVFAHNVQEHIAFVERFQKRTRPPTHLLSNRPRKRRRITHIKGIGLTKPGKYLSMSRRRKRYYGRKRYGGASSIARKALSKVRKLERKQEVKFHSIVVTTIANVSTTGDVRSLALIAQGDSRTSRDGNKISPFFLSMRINWIGAVASTADVYRTIIFRDMRQASTVVPTVLTVLSSGTPLSQVNVATHGRWKILYDRTFTSINDAALRAQFSDVIRIKLNKRMGFRGAATTDINENGLFMINITNLAANLPSVVFSSRMFFND